jgi:dTDP-4-amino-4,6-dideoxygalactose transaminase
LSNVPFSRTNIIGSEIARIASVLEQGVLSGPGAQSAACEKLILATTGGHWAAVVPSCTAALEMSAILLNLAPGDEVILPSFTFVSTATAIVLRGACPVFVDVDPITQNICPRAVEAAVTPRTRAIFVVHYAGVVADMTALCGLACQHGLAIVEDAAQAYGASRSGKMAGSFGATSAFSFHGTKNISAGEAGALVVNDPALSDRAAILREKGTDRGRFLRGAVDAYTWQDLGSSQIISELTAAFLCSQLERVGQIHAARLALWNRYHSALRGAEQAGHFILPHPPLDADHNAHIFFLMLPDEQARHDLRGWLSRAGIAAVSHYVPLHSSPAGLRFGRSVGDMRATNRAAQCLLRLPLWNGLEAHQDRVISAVQDWCATRQAAT